MMTGNQNMNLPSFKINFPQTMKESMMANFKDVIDSGMVATGKYARRVEEIIKEKTGSKNVFAVNSGSSALEAAAYALKKEHGWGKVLIPANTFVATSFAFERQGFDIVIGNPPYVRQKNIRDPREPADKITTISKIICITFHTN